MLNFLDRISMLFAEVFQKHHEIACHCSLAPSTIWVGRSPKCTDLNPSDDGIKFWSSTELLVGNPNSFYSQVHGTFMQHTVL